MGGLTVEIYCSNCGEKFVTKIKHGGKHRSVCDKCIDAPKEHKKTGTNIQLVLSSSDKDQPAIIESTLEKSRQESIRAAIRVYAAILTQQQKGRV